MFSLMLTVLGPEISGALSLRSLTLTSTAVLMDTLPSVTITRKEWEVAVS